MAILELEGVSASYDRWEAIHDVGISLEPGDAIAILGANGAGKTTTLRAISGMVKATGRITFDGKQISGLRPDQVARLGIAHVPQGRGSLTQLTVRENLLVGAYGRRNSRQVSTDMDFCFGIFPQLKTRIRSHAAMLSGGEQQMLAIARGIMAKPRLLLLDEPSLGLAPSTAQQVYAAIARLREEVELSMVIVEENAALAFTLAESAVVLEVGRVVLAGPRSELIQMDAIREAYLGG